jgi:serine/threonine protein kinase
MFITQYKLSTFKPQTKPKVPIKNLDTNERIKLGTHGIYKVVTEEEQRIITKIGNYKYMMKYTFSKNSKFLMLNFHSKSLQFNKIFSQRTNPQIVIFYIKQLLELIKHIHSKGVILRDIDLQYIWLGDDGNIQLLDFRNATDKPFNDNPSQYIVPPMTEAKMYYNVDYFLLGVMLHKMITRKDDLTKQGIETGMENEYLDIFLVSLDEISNDNEIKELLLVLLNANLENVNKLTEIEECAIIKAETRTDPPFVFNKTTNSWKYVWVTENKSTEPRNVEHETKQGTSVQEDKNKQGMDIPEYDIQEDNIQEDKITGVPISSNELRRRKHTNDDTNEKPLEAEIVGTGYQDTHNIFVFNDVQHKKKDV